MTVDPRTFQLELSGLASSAARAATADPLRAGPAGAGVWKGARPLFGRVIVGVPYARTYKVQVEGLNAAIPCRDLTHSGLVPYGPRQLATYPPGTGVLVILHPQLPEGVIVGAVPDPATDPRIGTGDYLTQGGRTGVKVDLVNSLPFYSAHGGGISDFSAGRPMDSTGAEWGAMTETGLAVFLDPFQAYLRVDEETGLFVFYHDQLTRLAGHNLQVRSALREFEHADDRGEVTGEGGWATYLWEAQGRRALGDNPSRELTADQSQRVTPSRARYEPAVDDQMAFHRWTEYRGYLGQGFACFLSLPPAAGSENWPHRLSAETTAPGVYAEHLAVTGRYTARSVKGMTFGKAASISVPKRVKSAPDPTGDGAANYNAAGTDGDGPEHLIVDRTAPEVSDGTEGVSALAAVTDQLGYQYQWEEVHPFYYHEKDYYLPPVDESGFDQAVPPTFAALATSQYLPVAPSVEYDVDHRVTAKYYAAESFLHFADDGGIVLADGYGAELRMSQGSIFLSAPGDVWLQPGKNLNAWCGHDAVLKARGSVDATASVGDVRLKGQRNVMVGAGFNGCGGIVLESRGTAASYDFTETGEAVRTTGILLISRNAPVVAAGKDLLLTSNWRDYGGTEMFKDDSDPAADTGEFTGGGVCIDAGNKGRVSVYGKSVKTHVKESIVDVFAAVGGDPDEYVVNEYTGARAAVNTPLDVADRLLVDGSVMVRDDIYTRTLATETGVVDTLDDPLDLDLEAVMAEARAARMAAYALAARHDGRQLPENGRILAATFTFRRVEDYKTDGLILYEARWQQQARQTGEDAVLFGWNETPAGTVDGETDTYPHPGEDPWLGETYRHQDATLYDVDAGDGYVERGTIADGASPYEDPQSPAPEAVVLADNYLMLFES